jgi:hypothetical protein
MTDTHVDTDAGSHPNTMSRDRWATRIKEAWQKQVPAIFEIGVLLESAKAELRRGEWNAMVKNDLPFNRQTAFKLQKIASDDRLRNVSPGKLPAHWTLLYELTRLTDEQFEHGVATGVINARMQRKDIKELRGDQPRVRRPGLREQLAEAQQEIEQLTRMGGNLFNADTPAPEVARVLVRANFSPSKVNSIITEWRRLLRERESTVETVSRTQSAQ